MERGSDEVASKADELPMLMVRVLKAMVLELSNRTVDPPTAGMTPVHGIAMRHLDAHHDVTVVGLAEHLRVTKQSASEIVTVLERASYVRRRPHPEDGRARVVELTATGRKALAASRARWAGVIHGWEGLVGADDLATTRRCLERYLEAHPPGS